MNKPLATLAISLGVVMIANGLDVSVAQAQERRDRRVEERRVNERFASPHWVYDARHNHGHYYPSVGYSVATLPGTRIAIGFRGRHLFFNAGVWFEAGRGGYVVVAPPIGVVVPMLPPAYVPLLVAGITYYYANETYYAPVPGGYSVVAPPPGVGGYIEQPVPGVPSVPPQPGPPPAPAPSAGQSANIWYYCESVKTYYPYVSQCPEGWKTVPAAPPSPGR